MFNFESLRPSLPFILEGIGVTLQIVLGGAVLGLALGTLLSLLRLSKVKALEWFSTAYVSLFRGTPLVVQLVMLHFVFMDVTGIDLGDWSPILALGLNSAAYTSEIIRAGILAVDKGQTEAAKALGVPYGVTMKNVILPQAFKNILPAIINEMTALTKESAVVTIIGTQDIMRRAMLTGARSFRMIEPMILAALIYYVLVMVISAIGKFAERRLAVSD